MALFGMKSKQSAKNGSAAESKSAPTKSGGAPARHSLGGVRDLSPVLTHARITEKASDAMEHSVYVFDVARRATKRDVMQAVQATYNVSPKKVRVVTIPPKMKRSMRTGKTGMKSGGKKAYVYLKAGETITIS
jgi:ribosomal protein L23